MPSRGVYPGYLPSDRRHAVSDQQEPVTWYWWCRNGMVDDKLGDGMLRLKTIPPESFIPTADYDRDIKALETRIGALESLRRADAKAQERMRERLDKYESSDWRQKEQIAEQAATIIRQRASIDLLDTLPDAHKIAEQAKTIKLLEKLLRRERYEVVHTRGCDCDLCVAVDAAPKEARDQ